MKTQEMINAVAEEFDLSKSQVKRVYLSMVAKIHNALKKGEPAVLQGLGILRVRDRKERMGRNPRTGEQIRIPAKKVIKFRVKKELKKEVLGI